MRRWTSVVATLVMIAAGCARTQHPPAPGAAAAAGAAAPAGAGAGPARRSAAGDDAAYYHQARAWLAAGDRAQVKGLDFRRVRRGSMLVNFVGGAGKDSELDRSLNAAIASGDQARVLATARELLDRDTAYGPAHLVAGTILRQQGREAQADLHLTFANGMLESILSSGDGRAPGSAFVVFHVREEYEVARVLRAEVQRQSLRHEGDRAYDMLTVRRLPASGEGPAEGPDRQMYFDITELFALEGRALDLEQQGAAARK
jgi:hypothetical protein